MKKAIFLLSIVLFSQITFGQKKLTLQDSIANYFKEIKVATKKNQQLWGKDLYGALLFVNPVSRQLYSNAPDSADILKTDNKIYSGVLPNNVNIANTSLHWNGKDWAMIMLPLPTNKQDRINLLAHELFHKAQPSSGFSLFNTENNHLDQKDGRMYLRLELNALKKAVRSSTIKEINTHLTNALTFRKYRYSIYPKADTTENLLELNEGIAEYTGEIISGRNKEPAIAHFEKSIDNFLSNPTFVRSFPYQTIPVYGYLLHNSNKDWNKQITIKTNLTNYFINAFNLSLPYDLKKTVEIISSQYDGQKIFKEETARETKTKQLIAEYKNKFIEQPHFEIQFEKMNVSFNPGNIMPIEDKGTFYPNIR
ncbi:MAG: hypothetical protein ACR2KX_01835, partial [Chitinophagaceae bacterium]